VNESNERPCGIAFLRFEDRRGSTIWRPDGARRSRGSKNMPAGTRQVCVILDFSHRDFCDARIAVVRRTGRQTF
jgi:hypothetical protein